MGTLLQQFVVEGVLLSLAGAALGMLLAFGGLRLLVATNAGSIPRVAEIGIDWQVLLFTLGVSVATGIVVRPGADRAHAAQHAARHAESGGRPRYRRRGGQPLPRGAGDRRTGARAGAADRLRPDGEGLLETAGGERRLQSR